MFVAEASTEFVEFVNALNSTQRSAIRSLGTHLPSIGQILSEVGMQYRTGATGTAIYDVLRLRHSIQELKGLKEVQVVVGSKIKRTGTQPQEDMLRVALGISAEVRIVLH